MKEKSGEEGRVLTGAHLKGASLGVHWEVVETHGAVGVDGQPGRGLMIGEGVIFLC